MKKRLIVLLVGIALLASLLLPASAFAYSVTNESFWNGQYVGCTVHYSYYNSSYWRVNRIYCHMWGYGYVGPVIAKVYSAGSQVYYRSSSDVHYVAADHNWYPGVLARRYNSKVINDNKCWTGSWLWRTLHPDF